MQYIKPDVATICTVWLLLWERYCYVQVLKETFITTFKSNDSPTIRRSGVATDGNQLERNVEMKDELYNIISTSGQTLTKCTRLSVITG
jgi:hypothetical protein